MNTLTSDPRISRSQVVQKESRLPAETEQLVALGEIHNWNSRLLGKAPIPDRPIRLGDWLLVPAQEDSSPIPARTFERIQTIYAAGIRPKGFVLVHEAPMLLPGPREARRSPKQTASTSSLDAFMSILGAGATVLSALGAVASILIPAILMGAAMLDPILVAVTEDDHWIEIDRWWTE